MFYTKITVAINVAKYFQNSLGNTKIKTLLALALVQPFNVRCRVNVVSSILDSVISVISSFGGSESLIPGSANSLVELVSSELTEQVTNTHNVSSNNSDAVIFDVPTDPNFTNLEVIIFGTIEN